MESAFAVGNRSDTVNSIVYLEFLLVIGLLGFKVLIFLEKNAQAELYLQRKRQHARSSL